LTLKSLDFQLAQLQAIIHERELRALTQQGKCKRKPRDLHPAVYIQKEGDGNIVKT
jgi:hypothetical protein